MVLVQPSDMLGLGYVEKIAVRTRHVEWKMEPGFPKYCVFLVISAAKREYGQKKVNGERGELVISVPRGRMDSIYIMGYQNENRLKKKLDISSDY